MKKLFVLIATVVVGFVLTRLDQAPVEPTPTDNEPLSELYTVLHVVDGDTIIVAKNGTEEKVRLLGIDTPEVDESRGPIECYGKEASEKTASLLSGQAVYLETDPTQAEYDTYGRLLAYVYTSDNILINKILVEGGYAREYTYNVPYTYQADFQAAEKTARIKEEGLWSKINCPR